MKKSKYILYTLIFLLPMNLGKHFIFDFSYVKGLLIDYLIPTLYVQDILAILLLITYFFENRKNLLFKLKSILSQRIFLVFYLFIFSVFLSSVLSTVPIISYISLLRITLYFFVFLYISLEVNLNNELTFITNILFSSLFLVCILSIFQIIKQGSVFNNYILFGEQPYSFSTFGVIKENLFGFSFVPPYGLFRHPNILGGVLSVVFLLKIAQIKKYGFLNIFFVVIVLLVLLLTLSFVSLLSLATLLLSYYLFGKRVLPYIVLSSILVGILLPTSNNPSLYRRNYLNNAAFNMISSNVFYGVGPFSFTSNLDNYVSYFRDIRFVQPVHNLYLLVLSETGFISFLFFSFILFGGFYRAYVFNGKELLLVITLILMLFSFDHYFWTIHQSHLLFWIILGLCWTKELDYSYNQYDE